ncbi:hypothetical protein V5R04_07145 [Jonesiaceae bacterium BS-20]|uniref:DNMP kinase n=1 Tax=Jonesiaceae bacterium BS-20 TaxID=3120821 RepID=A0AAU7DZ42_9MICO
MIVGFSGLKRSGKDTAGSYLTDVGFTRMAFADKLRDVCEATNPYIKVPWTMRNARTGLLRPYARLTDVLAKVGWDDAKSQIPDVRRLLERLATEGVRDVLGDGLWADAVMRDLDLLLETDSTANVVLTDVRFANEAEAIRARGGVIIQIQGRDTPTADEHSSNQGLPAELVNGYVTNPFDATFKEEVIAAIDRAFIVLNTPGAVDTRSRRRRSHLARAAVYMP